MLFALGASYFVLLFKSSLRRDFCVGVRGKEETFVFYAACQCIDFDLFFWIYFKRGALGNLMILWHMNKKRHWRSCWVGSKKVHRGVQVEDHNVKNILFSWPEENPKYLDAKSTYLVLEITGYYLRKILTRRILSWSWFGKVPVHGPLGLVKWDFYSCYKALSQLSLFYYFLNQLLYISITPYICFRICFVIDDNLKNKENWHQSHWQDYSSEVLTSSGCCSSWIEPSSLFCGFYQKWFKKYRLQNLR